MKKVLSVLVAAALVTMATSAMATIVGTKHDLSSVGGAGGYNATNTTQVCVFCHTPHNSIQTRALWNRNQAAGTFTTYTSGANAETAAWYVGGVKGSLPASSPSMLCLSCHDGATTMNNLVRPPAGVAADNNVAITSVGTKLGFDLTNDHPISIIYAQAVSGATGTLNAAVAGKVNTLPLANGVSLECNTCHNVHDNTMDPFLRLTMDASALCTACHIK
jgi:predicted CXXCH cytochrome family protein